MAAEIEDTYAEAFRSIYAQVLVTAVNRTWLDHAVNAVTGHASSSILCDCEAGVDRYVGPGGDESFKTPDGRPGVILQFHLPRFKKDREATLEKVLLARLSQNILTCPTTACFNLLDTDPYFKLGRKIALFGDGWQYRTERYGRKMWAIPIMSGEFVIDRRFGFRDGIMGGNLWFMGVTQQAALEAAERARDAALTVPDCITPFPGGVASSGSKAGSKYSFLFASTNHPFCPTLREKLGTDSQVPAGVVAIQEIIINGRDLEAVTESTKRAIDAAKDVPGVLKISAGNYNGRLGKNFIYLRPQQPAQQ